MSCKLILFVKNPELGKVKTRIAKTSSDEKALQIYHKLIKHTLDVASSSGLKVEISFSSFIDQNKIFNMHPFEHSVQMGDDLGMRMQNAFKNSYDLGVSKTIIIGSDCLQLTKEHLLEACESLNSNDVVLGPAVDGGYYLIGLKKPEEALLLGKNWSHEHVLREAMDTVSRLDMKLHLLERLSDIDTYSDWLSYKHLITE